MNGYMGIYKNKRFEVYSDTSFHAQQQIAKEHNIKKYWEITIILCEKDGETVIHHGNEF